jgi:hypothetical protein
MAIEVSGEVLRLLSILSGRPNGIFTPLSPAYEAEILRRTGTSSLESALKVTQSYP